MSDGVSIDTDYYFRVEYWEPLIAGAEQTVATAAATLFTRSLQAQNFASAAPSLITGLREVATGVQSVALEVGGADFAMFAADGSDIASTAAALNAIVFPDTPEGRKAEAEYHAAQVNKANDENYTPTAIEVEQTADFLEEHQDDPEVMETFYSAVPPEALLNYTASLWRMDNGSFSAGTKRAQNHYLTQTGASLGKASKTGALPAGYDTALVDAVESDRDNQRGRADAMGELLYYGDYSTGFYTGVTNGLVEFDPDGYNAGLGEGPFEKAPLGFSDDLHRDPVTEAFASMTKAGDEQAIYDVTLANADTLANRSWHDGATAYAGAVELAANDPSNPRRAGQMKNYAIRYLPTNFATYEPSTEARQSLANVMAFHWPEVAAVTLTKNGSSTVAASAGGSGNSNLPDPFKDFTRDEAEAAMSVTMDLSDLEGDPPSLDTPTATIVGANAEYSVAEVEEVVSRPDATTDDFETVFANNLNTMGFVTQAGFKDEIEAGEKHDARMAKFESLTTLVVKTAVGIGIGAVPIGGGTVGPAVAKEAGKWGAEVLTKVAFPDSNEEAEAKEDLCNVQAAVAISTEVQWATVVLGAAEPVPGEPKVYIGPGGVRIDLSEMEDLQVNDDGDLDWSLMTSDQRSAVALEVEKRYGIEFNVASDAVKNGSTRAGGDADQSNIDDCPS